MQTNTLYISELAAPLTVNTMPEGTLRAFADHGKPGQALAPDGGDCQVILKQFVKSGINTDTLASTLQAEGVKSFSASWDKLAAVVKSKAESIAHAV